eukprot:TRINITY_DN38837_c0_g1_i1.p1 TRINITY_DN38837_c0_g1~~TRINITY_DN38837_c0_g1_i1.p1  ORF type:complete len:271 (+),score=48.60 TRINITY_DN38837_c0_g1_i1:330-1142(+)
MATTPSFTPPATIEELLKTTPGLGRFSAINSPVSGAREQKDLPKGSATFQLYSLGTPNGQKVTILLEELGIQYDAHTINIMKGQQFTSGFVALNPNSKIPTAVDLDGPDGKSVRLFESASIMLYLAEKHGKFIPKDVAQRAEMLNWLFWQMGGQGPMTGQFGHFFVYAPDDQVAARNYGAARYGMEVQRLCDVLDKQLEGKEFILGEEYTIADMAIFPWSRALRKGYNHPSGGNARTFLGFEKYKNVNRWLDALEARPAVERGLKVNSMS